MRIAFVFYDRPNWFGGPAVNARRLLPALKRRGHEIVALIPFTGTHSPAAEYLQARQVECRSVPRPRSTEALIRWYLAQVRDLCPDVFVSNESIPGHFAGRWMREAGIVTIAAHRSDNPFHWAMVGQFVTGPREWAVTGLVCVAKDFEDETRKRQPGATALCTIASGVPVPPQSIANHSPFRLAYVGRLYQQQKRIHDVVRCMCDVVASRNGVSGVIIGDGPEAESVRKIPVELGVGDRVRFAGVAPDEHLYTALQDASAILLLSDYEGTPGALMDGMACGLVPICRKIPGGVQELIDDQRTGVFVSDDESVAQVVDSLMADEDRWASLSHGARQQIIERFSLDKTAEKWEDFCSKLVDQVSSL